QAGPDAGQVPLRAVGVGVEQVVGRDDLQHAVAQELQPFVVGHRDAALVGIAGVGQGRGQQAGVLEGVADDLFKRMRHGCYALLSGQFSVWLAWAAAALAAATSSRAACMVPHRSFSTQIFAWRMAFLMALALEEPWALMTGCRAPRKGAPPYSSLSICFFSSATLPFIIRPASLPVALDKKAPLTMPIIILAMPSVSLRTTLPVKPTQTTTSTLPAGISRGSMLPTKRMPGVFLSFWWVSRS